MSLSVEKLEGSMAKLTIEVPAEEFTKAITAAYNKNKNKFAVPGFRKGKVPQFYIEKMYGAGVFYEDAANAMINEYYPKEAAECGEEIVSSPEIDVVQIEKGKDFIFTATVALKPELKLGEYKGVEIEKIDSEVTDADVMAEILKTQKENARTITVEDRPAKMDDEVTINFEGFIDDEAFEGGKGENYKLTLGSHSFIDTFEEQLIGKKAGEDVEVNVTFPEDYHSEDLKGKAATFKVKINSVKKKELPELDDDFAQDISEFDTFAEYKEDLVKKLQERRLNDVKYIKEREAVAVAADNAEIEIPEAMLETQVTYMIDDFGRRLKQQGLDMETYMKVTGNTMEQMREQMRPESAKQIKGRLVLEAVAEAEKIEIADEKIDEEIEKMSKRYGMTFDELKKAITPREIEQMKQDLACNDASELIGNAAVEVEKKEETTEE